MNLFLSVLYGTGVPLILMAIFGELFDMLSFVFGEIAIGVPVLWFIYKK